MKLKFYPKIVTIFITVILIVGISFYLVTKKYNPDCETAENSYRSGLSLGDYKLSMVHLAKHNSCEVESLADLTKDKRNFDIRCAVLKKKTPLSCLTSLFNEDKGESTLELMLRATLMAKLAYWEDGKKVEKLKGDYFFLKSLIVFTNNTSYKNLYFVKKAVLPNTRIRDHHLAGLAQLAAYKVFKKKMVEMTKTQYQKLSGLVARSPSSANRIRPVHLDMLKRKIKKLEKDFIQEKQQMRKIYRRYHTKF